ncbi:MAG: flagellin, partial [SAR324 cluster bacterium]|nr:flagellin [SAR324 cluster bacterium]
AITTLRVVRENLTAAESVIRDTDMAEELARFTRNQIMVQSSTAQLAQANAVPQNVVRLLANQ